jgi:hypothetical protein
LTCANASAPNRNLTRATPTVQQLVDALGRVAIGLGQQVRVHRQRGRRAGVTETPGHGADVELEDRMRNETRQRLVRLDEKQESVPFLGDHERRHVLVADPKRPRLGKSQGIGEEEDIDATRTSRVFVSSAARKHERLISPVSLETADSARIPSMKRLTSPSKMTSGTIPAAVGAAHDSWPRCGARRVRVRP